jgi:RNA polymerase sigma factor (sigma-70 family)
MQKGEGTMHTLIRRACDPQDEVAWRDFVEQYRRFIIHVLREMSIHMDEIDDLSQQILLTLTRDLPGYDRSKGRFRSWLSAVIRHTALSHLNKQRYRTKRMADYIEEREVNWLNDRDESEISLMIENEWAAYVGKLAMDRVSAAFRGNALEAYELFLDGLSASEIAEQTKLTVSSVYTLRKRVKRRLYLEIRAITAELEPPVKR